MTETQSPSHKIGPAAGFSLVELVVIVLLLGILAVAVFPRFSSPPVTVGASADQMAADIRYVQALSMTRGARYCFYLTSTTSYALRTGTSCTTAVNHPATGSSSPISLSDITYTATNLSTVYIEFDTKGQPTTISPSTGSAQITLSGGGETRVVSVTGVTGRVVLQ